MDQNAFVANEAYGNVDERATTVGSFSYRPEVSDSYHAVYHDPRTSQTMVGIRGTADFKDVLSDVSIVGGVEDMDPRFRASERKLQEITDTLGHGDYGNVKVMGHSLGGQVVSRLVARHGQKGLEGHAYNPGSGPLQTLSNSKCHIFNTEECSNQRAGLHVHTVDGDPLSVAWHITTNAASATHTRYAPQGFNAHSMFNFSRAYR